MCHLLWHYHLILMTGKRFWVYNTGNSALGKSGKMGINEARMLYRIFSSPVWTVIFAIGVIALIAVFFVKGKKKAVPIVVAAVSIFAYLLSASIKSSANSLIVHQAGSAPAMIQDAVTDPKDVGTDPEGVGSKSIVESDPESIPDYSGADHIVLNGNMPCFNEWDLNNIAGEHYSDLDSLGRCGTAYALLDRSMMPAKGKREDMGHIKPSGWRQRKYEGLVDADPPFLYNRSHLIARALAGEEANERNLITGTRYMNATTMLPWEEMVMRYFEENGNNHVLYRVTPYFKGDDLLARGVEMEAYSVEDNGRLCYHIFVYNVQPGIELDYATGKNRPAQ